jgi:hypothetical protein
MLDLYHRFKPKLLLFDHNFGVHCYHPRAIPQQYLSYFMVDHHLKIICQVEIDMTSLLPSPQAPVVGTPDPSFKAFME